MPENQLQALLTAINNAAPDLTAMINAMAVQIAKAIDGAYGAGRRDGEQRAQECADAKSSD